MLRGLYTAATGMIHQRYRLDTIANNLSNVNTKGYKKDEVVSHSFKDELLLRLDQDSIGARPLGPLNHGVYAERIATFHQDGPLEQTEMMTDLALQGSGFFVVQGDDGPLYTRDGTFKVNDEGILTTLDGRAVLGEGGPIRVGQEDFIIDEEGYVWQWDNLVGRLQLQDFEDPAALDKIGDNLFANNNPGANPAIAFEGRVFQGYSEHSNVQPLEEITDMIVASRTYDANYRVLQMIDNTLAKTVNDIGTV